MTTDPALVERVADVLEALDGGDLEDIARAVLDAITTHPRYALVELPEPIDDDGINTAWPHASYWREGGGITSYQIPRELDQRTAKAVAADLLAALHHAESTATEQD